VERADPRPIQAGRPELDAWRQLGEYRPFS
jgi:hypothetical protein